MTREDLILEVVLAGILFGFFLYLYLYLWEDLRIEWYRHRLFVARDQLFDAAAGGLIEFEDPAYTTMRGYLNGMIRFAHRINFWDMVGFYVMAKAKGYTDDPEDEIQALTKNLREDAKRAVRRSYAEMMFWTMINFYLSSLIGIGVFVALAVYVIVCEIGRSGVQGLRIGGERAKEMASGIAPMAMVKEALVGSKEWSNLRPAV